MTWWQGEKGGLDITKSDDVIYEQPLIYCHWNALLWTFWSPLFFIRPESDHCLPLSVTRWLMLSRLEWCNSGWEYLKYASLAESESWCGTLLDKKFWCVPKYHWHACCSDSLYWKHLKFLLLPPFTSQSLPKESGATETILQIFLLPPSSAVP